MTAPDLRAQLADVEDQIRTLRGETGDLSETGDGPMDSEESAAALTNAEENGALIDMLVARRATLTEKLGQSD